MEVDRYYHESVDLYSLIIMQILSVSYNCPWDPPSTYVRETSVIVSCRSHASVSHFVVGMSFRDSTVAIIETGRTVVRAGLGLHDLLRPPSVVREYCPVPSLSYATSRNSKRASVCARMVQSRPS